MVRIAGKNLTETVHPTSNDNSLLDYDGATTLNTGPNINSSIDTANAMEGDDIENQYYNKESSVWKYAKKVGLEKARCNICQIELSRKGQSTSSIRRHLRSVHKLQEFGVKRVNLIKDNRTVNKLSTDQKQKLRQLAVNAIIEDGRSFNDLNKPGITKLFNGLLDGFRAPHRNTVKRNLKRLNTVHMKKLIAQLNDTKFVAITTDFWCDHSSRSYLCMTGHWFNDDMVAKSKVLVFTPYFDRHTSLNISSELEHHLRTLKIFDKTTTITCDGASNMKASFKSIDSRIKRLQCLAHKLHLIVCNALGLWIKPEKQNDNSELNGNDDDDEGVLDYDMRSLSLNQLNNDENTSAPDENQNDKISNVNEELDEETEPDGYLSTDFWEDNVNTDPNLATNLQEVVGNILYKCRSTIKMINKSSNITSYIDQLKDIHNIDRCLSIDCKSRWNSTQYMIENLLKFKLLINQLHLEKHDLYLTNKGKQNLTNLELTSDEWLMLASIDEVLTPFNKATKLMSGSKYSTIGTALFAIRKIKSFLEDYSENNSLIIEMRDLLLEQIVKYIDDDTEQLELIIFLAYFDPLGFSVLTQKERTTVERIIKQTLKDMNDDLQNVNNECGSQTNRAQSSSSSTFESSENIPSKIKSAFSSFLNSVSTNATKKNSTYTTTNNTTSIADEFLLYKSLAMKEVQKMIETESNSAANEFWRIFGNQLPQLKYLAKRYLCTPATSVPSESAFSIASNLGRRQRARLHPHTLAITVFLKDKINEE